jgi:hypothetical protein
MPLATELELTTSQWHLNCIGRNTAESAVFHVPYPFNAKFEKQIEHALTCHNRIVIMCSELHAGTVDFITRFRDPRITYFLCGFVDGITTDRWMDWFITTTEFYKHSDVLDQLVPYQTKPKTFDILLGQSRLHRDYVYNYVHRLSYTSQVIMTYMSNIAIQQQDTNGWIHESVGVIMPDYEFKWTVTPINYYNTTMSLSQVVPIEIYNQTAYTIVTETNFDNHYSFYTEKIVKPILAERLFLVFSGQYYLRNLHRLGFKTFSTIIDERYDGEADSAVRFAMVCNEMDKLFKLSQQQVFDQIRSITEHNRKVMLETDWLGQFHANLKSSLADSI